METPSKATIQDAAKLNKLMPNLVNEQRIENSVVNAESKGDKKVRANNERRIAAHLTRLTRLLELPGVETKVWHSAVQELVVDEVDIPESYWEQQKQIARDNGLGDIHLGNHEKRELTSQLQEAQRTGLESWRTYLETTGDQYPLWFKFYAWDGMSHLGTFNKQKGIYNKRSKGTIAPYPQLNPAALAKVYEAIENQGGDDQNLSQLIKRGNFNKIYSHNLLDQKAIIPTPENPEDVHGEWREYTSDDIQAITEAAEGTPWCIAGETMAKSYTKDGGKFILFHLQDAETGILSPTAAASIRLDEYGKVAELSGLKGGSNQYLEDSLVPTVHEKVKDLPGGKKYLQAFDDKQTLIAMDKKFQAGEPFTKDELLFLYEVNRPIKYIDTYASDPRVYEFKRDKSQHINQLMESEGVDKDTAKLMVVSVEDVEANLYRYLRGGFDPTAVANKITPIQRFKNLNSLLQAGAEIDLRELYNQLEPDDKLKTFTTFQQYGIGLNPDELVEQLSPNGRLTNFKWLKSLGATIEPNEVADLFSDKVKLQFLRKFTEIGAAIDVDKLLHEIKPDSYTVKNDIGLYVQQGASLETLKDFVTTSIKFRSHDLGNISRSLVQAGVSGDDTMNFIKNTMDEKADINRGDDSHDRIPALLKSGVEAGAIVRSNLFDNSHIEECITELLATGIDKVELMRGLGAYYTSKHIDELVTAGTKIDSVVEQISKEPRYVLDVFELLNKHGANLSIDTVVSMMKPRDVLYKIAKAKKLGATVDVNELLDGLGSDDYVYTYWYDDMIAAGADVTKIAETVKPKDVGYNPRTGRWNHWDSEGLRENYPEIYDLAYKRIKNEIAAKTVA